MKKIDFSLIDQTVNHLRQRPGLVIKSSHQAWQEDKWTRKYFGQRPQLGYFFWLKRSQTKPLASCISLATTGMKQRLVNLVVLEPGVKLEIQAVCQALKPKLAGQHQTRSQLVLKKNSFLKFKHQHFWGREEIVPVKTDFWLEDNSRLDYFYRNLTSPQRLRMENNFWLKEKAKTSSKIVLEAERNRVELKERLFLQGQASVGSLKLRLVGRQAARLKALSEITAEKESRGHLDCQGLLIDDKTVISLAPRLVNQSQQALLTHEASIGRIEQQKLEYLATRGLEEKEAISLLIQGFLETDHGGKVFFRQAPLDKQTGLA